MVDRSILLLLSPFPGFSFELMVGYMIVHHYLAQK